MRIVSLLGSATEIVFELGLESYLVGISHECDYPPAALDRPRVSRPRFDPAGMSSAEIDAAVRHCMAKYGSVYEVDRRLLDDLRPTLVLTQGVCEVCAVPTGSVVDAVESLRAPARVLSLDAHTIEEIFGTILQVAEAADAPGRGAATVEELQSRVYRVREHTADLRPYAVCFLEWLDPPFAPGHWVPEMVELAGGRNLVGKSGCRSHEIAWNHLRGLQPDFLFVEPCGFDLDRAYEEAERHRDRLESVAGDPLDCGRAWLLHSAWFSRSGPRVIEGVELLAHLLHPSRFPDIPLSGRARRWS